MKSCYYVVHKYNNDLCMYDSRCFTTLKAARRFIVGSARATITRCEDAYYGDFEWHCVGECEDVKTGRKCDEE